MFSNFFRIFFIVFINREACGLLSLQRGFDKECGVGMKSAVSRDEWGYNTESSGGVLSGGLPMEHECDK